ncbi:MAG TPA: N-acetylmuramidase family protein [Patescibacteria group bacterium]|nr:N-acetylmuramidase family protein [Patescibacteria group bacterium]
MTDITFTGPATKLDPDDIARAAQTLGCDPAAVAAVCHVESSGGGFLPDGRPKILFEAQTFHRLTMSRWDSAYPGISSPHWDRSLYGAPGGHQYDRLASAMQLDQSAALQSASWGLFQIMGTNYGRCGFVSIEAFVDAMVAGEGEHLDAFVGFIRSDTRLLAAIQGQDWPTFARLYNGPAYAENQYDTKLAAAFDAAHSLEA